MSSDTKTIYIKLLDEGTKVARPTQGLPLQNDLYLVLPTPNYNPDDEHWEFSPGSVVRCIMEKWSSGDILVAHELIDLAAYHYAEVARLLQAVDRDEKLYILSSLASEYQRLNRVQDAEAAIREQITLASDRPEVWMQLAAHFYRCVHDLPKALSAIEVAIEKALLEGNFVRQAHSERIRIALEMKNYQAVENSLTELIEYTPKLGSIDVSLESDFLPRIPVNSVRSELVENYKKSIANKDSV